MFKNCRNLEELRQAYKDLLKKHHPDNGGDLAKCQEINAEYKKAFDKLKNGRQHFEEEQDEPTSKKWDEAADELIRNQIFNFVHFDGLNIEIIGSWVWIDGNTFAYREELKAKGFKWSKSRKKWHWTSQPTPGYFKGRKSFDEIRNKYGSERIVREDNLKLA